MILQNSYTEIEVPFSKFPSITLTGSSKVKKRFTNRNKNSLLKSVQS